MNGGTLLLVMTPRSDYRARDLELEFAWLRLKTGNFASAQDAPMDMRREIRYRLDAPTVFFWESPHRGHVQAEGVTRNSHAVFA
jgi:hypothetical protein